MEEWAVIDRFPRYMVSNRGNFVNAETGRTMALSPNQFGDLTVGLMLDGRQYRRSAKVLVARAFVLGEDEVFNTPMLLDGDKTNIDADNIVWRPRWLAWEYSRQFHDQPIWYQHGPIVDRAGNTYKTIIECALINGELCRQIAQSIRDGTRVFPGGEVFAFVKRSKHI